MEPAPIPDFCLAVTLGPPPPEGWAGVFGPEALLDPEDEAGVEARLAARMPAVVDGSDLRRVARGRWVTVARRHHAPPVAVAMDPEAAGEVGAPSRHCRHRRREVAQALPRLPREGFAAIRLLAPGRGVRRVPLPCDRRSEAGPFDVVGDVHGCSDTLRALLRTLGYGVEGDRVVPPPRRRAVFVGDLVDRGPDSPAVLRTVMGMVRDGTAMCALGNHDRKLARALAGRIEGDRRTMAQMAAESEAFRDEVRAFLDALPSHLWLAGGRLVVVHAAIKPEMIGRESKALTGYALHGPTTGRHDARGHPIRLDWIGAYDGAVPVVHGHVPTARPAWRNNVIGVDTGCGMGGPLSALRWPEEEVVTMPAREV